MYIFLFWCLVSACVYFCHTTIAIIKYSSHIPSQGHLSEDKKERIFVGIFDKIIFQTVIMTVFPISFVLYWWGYHSFADELVVSSGIFTIAWLIISGVAIKRFYSFATHRISKLTGFSFDECIPEKTIYWSICPILCGISFGLYDFRIFFVIFSVVLGKYIWMDSSVLEFLQRLTSAFREYRTDIVLVACQASVVVFLSVRWFPIKDKVLTTDLFGYAVTSFIVLAFFLMPILDFFIINEMNRIFKLAMRSEQ